ncbi:MAG: type I glyceraldehyde-3-phosphate dehydrogenase [Thermodesulfobacteriota bacterium]
MANIAINGMGRIGRATLKIALDTPGLELAAVNDLVPPDNIAYLLKYDTVYGRYDKEVQAIGDSLMVGDKKCRIFSEKDPESLPWNDFNIDMVFECTGVFTKGEDMKKHLKAGAKNVILSAPAKSDDVPTIVYGVNALEGDEHLLSCASCTTNCITPVVEIIGRRIGLKKAIMTTIHAYTSTQAIVDGPSKKWRRGRAGASNLVPTTTGAAIATTKALPEYQGRFDGVAVRGPVAIGSIADIVFLVGGRTTAEEVNDIFREESASKRYNGIMGVSEDPIVSSDVIKDPRASIVDLTMTQVVDGDLVKVMSWYDNEWGYANQMVRQALHMMK